MRSPRKSSAALFACSILICGATVFWTVTERRQKDARTVKAQSFEIVDETGKVRARLGIDPKTDRVFFAMSNLQLGSAERPQILISVDKNGSAIHLADSHAIERVSIQATNTGALVQALSNEGKSRADLAAFDKGQIAVLAEDKNEASYLFPSGVVKKDRKGIRQPKLPKANSQQAKEGKEQR